MRIKIAKGLYVDSNTLIRVEWRKWYPALIMHEKYERLVKWTLRILAVVGIASSIISIDRWYISLTFALIIFGVELFFEKTLFEYTAMVFQPLPPFNIEHQQWQTNGFLIPRENGSDDPVHFGPTYSDEKYAIMFFQYIRTWVDTEDEEDKENTLVISLVIEPNEKYTTYIYANPQRKRLDRIFKLIEEMNKLKKYGKKQQNFASQLFYWHTLDFKDGFYIKKFIDFIGKNEKFILTPSVIQPFGLPPKFLTQYSIKKQHLKIKYRSEIQKNEPEYLFDPAKWYDEPEKDNADKERKKMEPDIFDELQKAFAQVIEIGFMPSQNDNVGVINLCFNDCVVPFEAYKQLITAAGNEEVLVKIRQNNETINLKIEIKSLNKSILLTDIAHDENAIRTFLQVNGGGKQVALLVGYSPANERQVILEKGMSPLVVTWELES